MGWIRPTSADINQEHLNAPITFVDPWRRSRPPWPQHSSPFSIHGLAHGNLGRRPWVHGPGPVVTSMLPLAQGRGSEFSGFVKLLSTTFLALLGLVLLQAWKLVLYTPCPLFPSDIEEHDACKAAGFSWVDLVPVPYSSWVLTGGLLKC